MATLVGIQIFQSNMYMSVIKMYFIFEFTINYKNYWGLMFYLGYAIKCYINCTFLGM